MVTATPILPAWPTTIAAVVLFFMAGATEAQNDYPTIERGFKPERAFQIGDIDNINLFNGQLTLRIPLGQEYHVEGQFSYALELTYSSQPWDYITRESGGEQFIQAWPARTSNAGLGWRLSLGEWWDNSVTGPGSCRNCYVTPDGAKHPTLGALHPGHGDGTSRYTTDSTYLRVRPPYPRIEFPNGDQHRFDTASGQTDFLGDRLGNTLDVFRSGNTWTLVDLFRSHTINFISAPHYGQVVGSVVLETFGGTQATYTFHYENAQVPRSCMDDDPQTSTHIQLPLLVAVTLPDGSKYSMPTTNYNLTWIASCRLDSIGSPAPRQGLLRGMTLPTLGRIAWSYRDYKFPQRDEGPEHPAPDFTAKVAGVGARVLINTDGTEHGRWAYVQSLSTGGGSEGFQESITRVSSPLGDRTDHYFRVTKTNELDDPYNHLYGLPVSPLESAPNRPNFLRSTKTYDCDGSGNNCQLVRSTYLKYRTDVDALGQKTPWNPRVEGTHIRYHDDGGRWAQVAFSRFDGLGHHRKTVTSGNFPGNNARTTVTNYNPTRGTYPGSFTLPGPNEAWVLNTYTQSTVTENSQSFRTLACFQQANGFLSWVRTFRQGTSQGGKDVLVRYLRDARGNPTSEAYFGGDAGGLPTTSPSPTCSLSGLPANQFRMTHAYQAGSRRLSIWRRADGSQMSFKVLDRTIDASTGLPSSSRDTAGVQTTYDYDKMGRLTLENPAGDARTTYTYGRAISSIEHARVTVKRLASGGSAVRTEEVYVYDGFGRLFHEQRKMPSGQWSFRRTQYFPTGWKQRVSQWHPNTQFTDWTQYLNYDPFGRPQVIRPPEGAAHDVKLAYFGDRVVTRTAKVATGATGGESNATTVERYDRQGRLWQITEPSGSGGGNVTTTYLYDAAGRLKKASTPAAGVTQVRQFVYDGRGFLTKERHPEKGPSGNGWVTYSGYNARGQVGKTVDGPFTLKYTYDRAGRVQDVRNASGAILKHFGYGYSNDPDDRSNGKVTWTERWNRVRFEGEPVTVRVYESYKYGGRGGRPSERITYAFTPDEEFVFTQGWVWNDLGLVSSLSYPNRQCSGCPGDQPRSVGFAYTQGQLTKVPNFASSLTYHPNGLPYQVFHTNGVRWTQKNDPNKHVRPRHFGTIGVAGERNWKSGNYVYDGAGNVKAIGDSRFVYDKISRLTSGKLSRHPLGNQWWTTQKYAFDPFGNITKITTDGVVRNTPTSKSTNRLSGAATYNARGDLTSWNGVQFAYGPFGELWRRKAGAGENVMLYTADDERLWQRLKGNLSLWTLRDLDGRLLRTYVQQRSQGTWSRTDDIWRGGQLLARAGSNGVHHLHVDHLGSTRLVTDGSGNRVAYNNYYPFGQIATPGQSGEVRFTGHERNNNGAADGSADIHYMHARHQNPLTGRFLSPDQAASWLPTVPQSWNRYTYGLANPINYIDLNGLSARRVHAAHTQMVLGKAGFGPSAIGIAVTANVGADSFPRRFDAPQHAVHDMLSDQAANAQGRRRAEWQLRRAINQAQAGKIDRSLRSLGLALHAAEDAITHRGLGNLTLTVLQGRNGSRWTEHDRRDESLIVTNSGMVLGVKDEAIHQEIVGTLEDLVGEYLRTLTTEQRVLIQCADAVTAGKGDCIGGSGLRE